MPRTTKSRPEPQATSLTPAPNGPLAEVLTLAEAAAYLRLPEREVLHLVHEQGLPARQAGSEWRFLKAAIQAWLSQPVARPKNDFWEVSIGAWKDDPHAEEIIKEIHNQRGRPLTEAK